MTFATTQLDRYLTVPQAAHALGCSPSNVRRLISSRRLRAFRIGREFRIAAADIAATSAA